MLHLLAFEINIQVVNYPSFYDDSLSLTVMLSCSECCDSPLTPQAVTYSVALLFPQLWNALHFSANKEMVSSAPLILPVTI